MLRDRLLATPPCFRYVGAALGHTIAIATAMEDDAAPFLHGAL